MSTKTTIGARIREIRVERDLKTTELAKRLGLSAQVVYRWEWGAREPRVKQLERVAEVLECSVAELLSEQPRPKPAKRSSRSAAA